MRAVSGIVFSVVWLIIVMMVGFIMTTTLAAHANDSGLLTGDAATAWTTFISMVWLGFGLLALTPLVLVAMMFMGLFGMTESSKSSKGE